MKKLELKNLTVKKLSKSEQTKVNGGRVPLRTSGPCNDASAWPVRCSASEANWN